MSPFQKYRYTPLDKNKREIRLLELHAAQDDPSQIRCSIFMTSLDNAPEYNGLSYCWSDASNPLTIEVNDSTLSVRSNLHSALRQLFQYQKLLRVLWVDAICINQEDIPERNHQITLMRDIYESARQTVVWLGEAADDSGLAFQLIEAWGNCNNDFDGFLQKSPFAFEKKLWDAASKLLQRQWWQRVWVYQEFVLSKWVIFACGPELMTNRTLELACEAWDEFPSSDSAKTVEPEQLTRLVFFGTGQINRLPYQHLMHDVRRTLIQRGEAHDDIARMDLLQLLRMTRDMEATDPRDKLYALLGVDDVRDIPVHPDYQHSVLKVYKDLVVDYIETRADLEILADAGVGIPERDLQLPSWVSDLRTIGIFFKGENFISQDDHASGNHISNPRIDASKSLLSTAGFVCDVLSAHDEPRELKQRSEQWAKLALSSTSVHPTGMAKIQVFFRTMVADTSGYGFGRPDFKDDKDWKDFVDLARGFMTFSGGLSKEYHEWPSEKYKRWLMKALDNSRHTILLQIFLKLVPDEPVTKTDRELLQPFLASTSPLGEILWPDEKMTEQEEKQSAIQYMEHAERSTMRKSFFITEKGYMGFGSAKLHEGDLVCIIFGCSHPLLLRETGDTYHLVGDAYIYGMMRGEMMAGFEAGKFREETFVIQ